MIFSSKEMGVDFISSTQVIPCECTIASTIQIVSLELLGRTFLTLRTVLGMVDLSNRRRRGWHYTTVFRRSHQHFPKSMSIYTNTANMSVPFGQSYYHNYPQSRIWPESSNGHLQERSKNPWCSSTGGRGHGLDPKHDKLHQRRPPIYPEIRCQNRSDHAKEQLRFGQSPALHLSGFKGRAQFGH